MDYILKILKLLWNGVSKKSKEKIKERKTEVVIQT